MTENQMQYNNEYGAFSGDGKEYVITLNKDITTPMPWSHIITNGELGTIITSNGGGDTWYINSREYKLTTWCNDIVVDRPSEIILIETNNKKICATPILHNENFVITYGFGYAKFKTNIHEMINFICSEKNEKISILKFKNIEKEKTKIKFAYMIEPVLGVDREYTKKHIVSKYDGNTMTFFNRYNENYQDKEMYMRIIQNKKDCEYKSEKINNVGNVNTSNFETISCELELEPNEEIELIFILGIKEETDAKYIETKEYESEYNKSNKKWRELINVLQVKTPDNMLNIMLNGWPIYQTLASRLLGRASFYQSGGAFGFRDQLQDSLALLLIDPKITKKQVLYHSEHQFVEGDVLHWWHPEKNNGIRTRYTDDLLWLVYTVNEYVKTTGDYEILNIETPYIIGKILADDENENYIQTEKSEMKESIYEHCKKAIDRSLKYGQNGLPLIGSGDWNDGMNEIFGESVWLGFFLYSILDKFINICEYKKDFLTKEKYEIEMKKIKENLNKNAWDGEWYTRAYFKDGSVLGSSKNDECKIDSIAQSWSVISNAGDIEKQKVSMKSVEKMLVDKENKIIKLLAPPFDKSKMEPGYIKAYIPGVRENGGQYTHAGIWVIIAESILGEKEKAYELYKMLNPIEHSKTREEAEKYKVEPYVIAGDIYAVKNLAGMGGWTWYTGSASWYYKAGIENILGFTIENGNVKIKHCLPEKLKGSTIIYKGKEYMLD